MTLLLALSMPQDSSINWMESLITFNDQYKVVSAGVTGLCHERPAEEKGAGVLILEDPPNTDSRPLFFTPSSDSSHTALPHMAVKSYLTAMPDERRIDR